jgi:hypothetical protein
MTGLPDFNALAKAAYPNENEPGPMDAMNALWQACFALDSWLLLVHPQSMGDPRPFIAIVDDYECAFAFTDSSRVSQFAEENKLLGPDGDVFFIAMSPAGVLEWIEQRPSLRLHFNFGEPGWYSPAPQLPRIREFLANLGKMTPSPDQY